MRLSIHLSTREGRGEGGKKRYHYVEREGGIGSQKQPSTSSSFHDKVKKNAEERVDSGLAFRTVV